MPPVYQPVSHLPNVVGMSLSSATSTLNALDLPVFVAKTVVDSSAASNTVLAQNPPAGVGVACQCAVGLTVSTR